MFKFLKFYILASIVIILVIGIALYFHRHGEIERVIELAEHQNVSLSRVFAHVLWPNISSFVDSASDMTKDELQKSREIEEIDAAISLISKDLPIVKVKIYDLQGLTVYSTNHNEIGEIKTDNTGYFSAARMGQAVSGLSLSSEPSEFSHDLHSADLVESYLPINESGDRIEGVIELYTNVSELVTSIRNDNTKLVGLFSGVVFVLFGLLFLAAKWADRTINQQYEDIASKNIMLQKEISEHKKTQAALKESHSVLDQRVRERTADLEREVNERKQVELELRKLSSAVEQSPAIILLTDSNGVVEYVNPKFTELTGYAEEEIIGRSINIDGSEGSSTPIRVPLDAVTTNKIWRDEHLVPRKDGTTYLASTTVSTIEGGAIWAPYFLVISEDITARKKTEDELGRQRQMLAHIDRVSLVGEMSTSIAHELNQPLSVISGTAQLSLKQMQVGQEISDDLINALNDVLEQAERANAIIQHMRSFIRNSEQEYVLININDPILQIAKLIQADANQHGARLDLELDDDLSPVLINPVQIQQVIVNLALNGLEAMRQQGVAERVLAIATRQDENHFIQIFVQDSGMNIEQKDLDRIFEPFFTTKSDGLGLGLFISRSIVEAHGGNLCANSNQNGGTVFRVSLPIAGDRVS